ncbi:hypothetical protein Alg130_10596 [Pyrenophora tritici-repentis]|nr:hypothetical protein Alg130_10596 [Pyrenophora tritici-repentis]
MRIGAVRKKLGAQGDSGDVAELAAMLEYMPLAIVTDAAYISQRAPRYLVAKYPEEFRKSECKRSSLSTHDDCQLRRDWEDKNWIVVTWQISFDKGFQRPCFRDEPHRGVQRSQKEFRPDIWKSDEEDKPSQSSAGDDQFEDSIVSLREFYFISGETAGTSFEVHALVQLATGMWLEANSKLEQWKQQFVSNLCAAFPTGEYENWAACQVLFAHARSAVEQPPEDESTIAEWATVLYRAAWFAERTGNIADAEMLATEAMKARKKVLG